MRFKDEWKRIGYNNPEIKGSDLNIIMSDQEALDFFNKLMHKYITLKKLNLDKEDDTFLLGFHDAMEFFEKDWDTWVYRTLPYKKVRDENLSYVDALRYIDVAKIEECNLRAYLYLAGILHDFCEYVHQDDMRGGVFIRKLGMACYRNHMKEQENINVKEQENIKKRPFQVLLKRLKLI